MKSSFLFLIYLFAVVTARPQDIYENESLSKITKSTCGYDSCNPIKNGVLNVHLVAHSHDDVGWLKTVDQYFFGSRTKTQQAGVQYIIDSVVDELIKDPNRRFVYVETAFFNRWWSYQNDQKRHHVKKLVSEGRLEFAGGGWSMNDEAVTHYQSIIDQLTWGLRMLNDTFGKCGHPKVGWQIDPFGHSREMANLWAQAGYDGLLLGRADFQDKTKRFANKEAEMIWEASDDIDSNLFTGIMFNNYAPPPGFCFDVLCNDDPIIDDIKSPEFNVVKKVQDFVKYVKNQAEAYKTNHVIVTMGEDFNYQDAHMWFKNLDKLIKYVNLNTKDVNVLYSTPSCYIKALHDTNTTFPAKMDDFLPYASDEHSYWTGFYTSRPTLKYFERKANNFLQVCKQLYAMTNLNEMDKIDLNMLRSAMGIMQHHDAVTGTEQQHVARDYARILNLGIDDCLITSKEALNVLMSENKYEKSKSKTKKYSKVYMPMSLCQLNITECNVTESSKSFVITVYNPLAHVITDYVRVPVTGISYDVFDPSGTPMKYQIVTVSESLKRQLKNRVSLATGELIFAAENLPPFGYRSYFINDTTKTMLIDDESEEMLSDYRKPVIIDSNKNRKTIFNDEEEKADNFIGNSILKLTIDSTTGLVSSVAVNENNRLNTIDLKQELLYYEAMTNSTDGKYSRPSGAYIFRPQSNAKQINVKPTFSIIKGPLVEEVHQQFSDWASQIIRIYSHSPHIEFEWLVGPIPIDDNIGKEVISRFTTNLMTNGVFYTDSNGRQMLKRVINTRPTWNIQLEESIAGNYYPIVSTISIEDENSPNKFFVQTDRAQGGSSLQDGTIELMVHRRLLYDDSFGVGEALNETEDGSGLVARGKHFVIFGNSEQKGVSMDVMNRQLALMKLHEPVIFLTPANNLTFSQWKNNNNEFSGTTTELPANVHILTLEPWKDKTVLLRLEHFLQKTDDPKDLSKPTIIDLRKIFSGIKVLSAEETTLGGNEWKKDSKRLNWNWKPNLSESSKGIQDNVENQTSDSHSKQKVMKTQTQYENNDDNFLVTLNPMEIKTFIIKAEFLD